MTSKLSLLSAALAIASFASLPALAQTAPAVTPDSTVHSDAAKTGTAPASKPQASTDKKAGDSKAADHKVQDKKVQATQQKPQAQVSQKPSDAPAGKTDSTTSK